MSQSGHLVRDSIVTTGLNFISRGIGFLVPILIAALFGTTDKADAYYLAIIIPTFSIQVIVVALSSAFVPVLVKQSLQSLEIAGEIVGYVILLLISGAILMIVVLGFAVPHVLPFMVRGMSAESLDLTIRLTLLLLPMILVSGLIGGISAVLNAQKRFIGPVVAPGIRAVAMIVISLLAYRSLGIYAVALGLLAGETISLLLLIYLFLQTNIKPKFGFKMPSTVRHALKLSVSMIVGMVAIRFNPIIDRVMAAPLGEGSISALDYAEKVILIPTTMLGAGFFVVILTQWSEMVAGGQLSSLRTQVEKVLTLVIFIILPLSVYFYIMRKPVVELLFERGQFTEQATQVTSEVLGIFALGLLPNILILILTRVYLALQDTRTPMLIGFANVAFNLVLNLIFIRWFNLMGIALSTTVTYCLLFLISWNILTKRIGLQITHEMLSKLAKITLAILIFSITVASISHFWRDGYLIWLAIVVTGFFGCLAYIGVAYLCRLPEMNIITEIVRRKLFLRSSIKENVTGA